MNKHPLLSVRNLCVDYITENGDVRAVNSVSFDIRQGEIFGLAGESGCGKSTVAFSVARLHKPPAYISGGEILFKGRISSTTTTNGCAPTAGNRCRWCSSPP